MSRNFSKKGSNHPTALSNPNLVYFSLSELHNTEYIKKFNVSVPYGKTFYYQIKINIKEEELNNFKLEFQLDEDTFWDEDIRICLCDSRKEENINSFDTNNIINFSVGCFNGNQHNIVTEILKGFPHPIYKQGSKEYEENRDYLNTLYNKPIMNAFLSFRKIETICIKEHLDMNLLLRNKVAIEYRRILMEIDTNNKGNFIKIEEWKNIKNL